MTAIFLKNFLIVEIAAKMYRLILLTVLKKSEKLLMNLTFVVIFNLKATAIKTYSTPDRW